MSGYFFSFEGIDGSGKTTLANYLIEQLKNNGKDVVYVSSVGFEPIDRITDELLKDKTIYDPYAHLFLSYANSRILIKTIIEPAIHEDKIVFLDRYYHSSIAYSLPLGIPLDWLENISSALLEPHKVIYCDVSVETALSRKNSNIKNVEVAFDNTHTIDHAFLLYQSKVKEAYKRLINLAPDKYIVVSNEKSIEEAGIFLLRKIQEIIQKDQKE